MKAQGSRDTIVKQGYAYHVSWHKGKYIVKLYSQIEKGRSDMRSLLSTHKSSDYETALDGACDNCIAEYRDMYK